MFKTIGAALAAASMWLIASGAGAQTPLTATAGSSYEYFLTSGSLTTAAVTPGSTLPPGLSVGTANLGLNYAIVGAPNAPGIFDFSIDVRDCPGFVCGAPTTTAYRMTVVPVPQTRLSDVMVNDPYTQQLSSGFSTASLAGGTLPPGLSINTLPPPSGGSVLTGTPNAPGDYTYQIRTQTNFCFPSCSFQTTEYSLKVVAGPTAVPTMTEWAMILFGALLAGAAAVQIQRRRRLTA